MQRASQALRHSSLQAKAFRQVVTDLGGGHRLPNREEVLESVAHRGRHLQVTEGPVYTSPVEVLDHSALLVNTLLPGQVIMMVRQWPH